MKWEKENLGELVKCYGGKIQTGPFGSQLHQHDYKSEGIPVIMPKDIINDRIETQSIARISEDDADRLGKHKLNIGDLVIPRRGDINKRAICKPENEGWLCGTGCLKIRLNDEIVDPSYLYYYFTLSTVVESILNKAVGSTMLNLSGAILSTTEIVYPNLSTQRKIASILSAYDDLIENNLKRIKLLEEKAQLHYAYYKPVEKFELKNKAEFLGRGVSPKYEDGSGFYAINQKANKGSMLDYNHFKSLDTKLEVPAEKFAKWGDLLINSLGEGTLGRVHFYTDKSDLYAVDQHMSIFRTSELHYTFYLYQFLASDYGQGLIETLKKGGTNMTMLNISDLRQLEVSFPKEKELKELWAIAEPMYKLKQALTSQNTKLREARDILLPKLMSGQIEV